MTNEELAVLAQRGDRDALHQLYERTHKLIYYILNKLIKGSADKMTAAGVTADDVLQLVYFILLDAVAAYKPDISTRFTAYLNYPARNQFNELVGYRTAKKRKEPLNASASLDEPIRDGEGNETARVDTIPCTAATRAFECVEDSLYAQQLQNALESVSSGLTDEQASIIRARYYKQQTVVSTSERLGIKTNRVRDQEHKALRTMRRHRKVLEPFHEHIISTHALHGTGFQCWKERGSVPERIVILLEELERQRSATC